jgi:sugar lactone lactonase YvrE
MAERAIRTLLEGGAFFEGPRWHEGRWWVSDFYRHLVLAVGADGGAEEVMTVEGQPSGLGWLPDGSLLAVSMVDRRILRRSADGAVSVHADVSEHCTGHLNDMVVDGHGRAIAADELLFPNGSVITPDGRTLIVGETAGARYTAFTIADDGSLTDRRIWAQMAPTPPMTTLTETLGQLRFGPDGCGLDADEHIWSADEVNARCARIAPDGEVIDEVAMPEGLNVFACMLGGADGRTLLMCAAPDFHQEARSAAREAVLLTTTVDVPHAGLP